MSDEDRWSPNKARLSIAQDLSEIVRMFAALKVEAVNRAGDPDIPGGMAMVLLGPGADVEAFGYAQMSELMGRTHKRVWLPNKGDVEPPLSYLASWNDIIRDARGQEPSTKRARLITEVDSIRHALDWMLSVNDLGEPWFMQVEDFADGLHKVRRAMENVLHDGDRDDKINARCKPCDEARKDDKAPTAPRLSVRKAEGDGGRDFWQCPRCHQVFDEDGVRRCWRHMFVKRGDAPEWVPLRAAASSVGRPVSTVRTWTLAPDRGDGEPKRDANGKPIKPLVESEKREDGRRWVRWSDVRAVDDTTRRRGASRRIA